MEGTKNFQVQRLASSQALNLVDIWKVHSDENATHIVALSCDIGKNHVLEAVLKINAHEHLPKVQKWTYAKRNLAFAQCQCVCHIPFFQSPKKVLEYQVILKTQMKLFLNIAMWIFQVNLDLILYLHRLCAFLVNALSQPFLEPSFQDKSLGFPNPGSKSIDCSS